MLLAEPKIHNPPYITIAGPKDQPFKTIPLPDPAVVRVCGTGAFYNKDKIAVFLRVDASELGRFWDKPNSPGSEASLDAHITLYNGSDTTWARTILSTISSFHIDFKMPVTELHNLLSPHPAQTESTMYRLSSSIDWDNIGSVTGINTYHIELEASENNRTKVMENLIKYVVHTYNS